MSPYQGIMMERIKQDVKWGENRDLKPERWLAILVEEVGEAADCINELYPCGEPKYSNEAIMDNLEYEIIQVAATCVAWLENLLRNEAEDKK